MPQAEFERYLHEMLRNIRRALSEIDTSAVPASTAADREMPERMRSLLSELSSIMGTIDIEAIDLARPTSGGDLSMPTCAPLHTYGTAGTYGSANGTAGTFGTYGSFGGAQAVDEQT
jgi:hypothetical protein